MYRRTHLKTGERTVDLILIIAIVLLLVAVLGLSNVISGLGTLA